MMSSQLQLSSSSEYHDFQNKNIFLTPHIKASILFRNQFTLINIQSKYFVEWGIYNLKTKKKFQLEFILRRMSSLLIDSDGN